METSFYKNSLGHLGVHFNKTDSADLIKCDDYPKYKTNHPPVKYFNPFNKDKPYDMP